MICMKWQMTLMRGSPGTASSSRITSEYSNGEKGPELPPLLDPKYHLPHTRSASGIYVLGSGIHFIIICDQKKV